MLAFTENMHDCLLCSIEYFTANECRALGDRRPFTVVQTFTVDTWEAALTKSAALLAEFAAAKEQSETSEPDPGGV